MVRGCRFRCGQRVLERMCMEVRLITVSLVVLTILGLQTGTTVTAFTIEPDIGQMNFMEICRELKLMCVLHEVVTEDGYILTIHRIRGDERRPVLLWPGIFDSSDSFILRGLNSTSAALAAAGYDVWVGNSRGNKYSRRHINLDPDEDKKTFWDFSFNKMAVYDLSATITYITYITGQEKLAGIGHSQGATMFYILTSTRPVYNRLIRPIISMAPIAYLNNIKPLFKDFLTQWPSVNSTLQSTKTYEVLEDQLSANLILKLACIQNPVGNSLCGKDFVKIINGDSELIESDFYKVIAKHYPTGTSVKDVSHFAQIYQKQRFANYDYGTADNQKYYDTPSPPEYDLRNVSTSVAILYGATDTISTPEDVELLKAELPNVVYYEAMDRRVFNHMDFVWGKDINVYLNPLLKELLEKYT